MLPRSIALGSSLSLLVLLGCGGADVGSQSGTEENLTESPAASSTMAAEDDADAAPNCWLTEGTTAEDAASRLSPRDSASIEMSAGIAKVCYGAPSARGRTVMDSLVPYGSAWRAGADEATALHLTFPALVAGVPLDPGEYSLITVPGEESWEIVVNANARRWGIPINEDVRAQDIGSGTVTPESTDSMVEQMRYRFEQVEPNRAILHLEWENTSVPIPIQAQSG